MDSFTRRRFSSYWVFIAGELAATSCIKSSSFRAGGFATGMVTAACCADLIRQGLAPHVDSHRQQQHRRRRHQPARRAPAGAERRHSEPAAAVDGSTPPAAMRFQWNSTLWDWVRPRPAIRRRPRRSDSIPSPALSTLDTPSGGLLCSTPLPSSTSAKLCCSSTQFIHLSPRSAAIQTFDRSSCAPAEVTVLVYF